MSIDAVAASEENILEDLLHQEDDEHLFGVSAGAGGPEEEDDVATSAPSSCSSTASPAASKDEHSDITDDDEVERSSSRSSRSSSSRRGKDTTRKYGPTRPSQSRDKQPATSKSACKSLVLRAATKGACSNSHHTQAKADRASSSMVDDSAGATSASTAEACSRPKRKGKSYDYATKLNYLFRDARFFLMKSNNSVNVVLAKKRGIWSTLPPNEARLNKAFEEARNVLLLFSIKESGRFAGLARLASPSAKTSSPVPWVLPPGISARALENVFKIDWICKKDLSFQLVQHLYNPWNSHKPVKIGRDGQEIEPSVAEELCRLFAVDQSVDLTPILRKSKEAARRQRCKSEQERQRAVPTSRPLSVTVEEPLFDAGAWDRASRKRRYPDYHPPTERVKSSRQGMLPVSRYATAGVSGHRSASWNRLSDLHSPASSYHHHSHPVSGYGSHGRHTSRHSWSPHADHHPTHSMGDRRQHDRSGGSDWVRYAGTERSSRSFEDSRHLKPHFHRDRR